MKKISCTVLLLIVCMSFVQAAADVAPFALRCEYLENPIGIDVRSPRLTWKLRDARHGALQRAFRIVVGTDSAAVAQGRGDVWDTGERQSADMRVEYAGAPLRPFTRYFWQVQLRDRDGELRPSAVAAFETGMFSIDGWKGYWIGDGHTTGGNSRDVKPAPCFRHEFTAAKRIRSARAYIAAAGLYELYVNGNRIGDHRLDPMYTHFDRRTLYVAYDVTAALRTGQNAIGVMLGNGWYNLSSTAVWFFDRAPWRDRPQFCMDLRITYDDGTTETVATDRDWKTSLGPVIFNSIYTGEHYDARLEQPGWNTAGFADSTWVNAVYRQAPSQNIVAQQLHPIRNVEKIPVKTFKKINSQRYIYDLGRNISGVSQIRVKGEAGTTLRLVHSEIMRPGDSIDIRNIAEHYRPTDDSDPFSTDIFILSGRGEEEFMPRFNYKGFQYVEVTADRPVELTEGSLTGWFMHSDLPPTGRVETSNPLLNRLWFAANNSYLSNMFGYPTDCPHREKNGWTGDANLAVELGLFNFDGITVYEKWLADHRDEQQPNGLIPNIIPTSGWGLDWATGPDWTGSVAIIPWAIYEYYGDPRLLASMYDNIRRYVDWLDRLSPSGLCRQGLGDWIGLKSPTPQQYTTTVYYYRVVSILTKAAKMFGHQTDYEKYGALADKIRTAFNNTYLNRETAVYHDGNQTEMSTALLWGLVPDDLRQKVADNLARRVVADNSHLDCGMLGSRAIFNALADNGYADLACTVLSQETWPGYGYWIVKDNATTLYEDWYAIGERKESSLNHIMFGEFSAWLYRTPGGIRIDPEHPGFAKFMLRPQFIASLNNVDVEYDSPRGKIVSRWTRTDKKTVRYDITVPANTSARLTVPQGYALKKAALASGEKVELSAVDGEYEVVAGSYRLDIVRL